MRSRRLARVPALAGALTMMACITVLTGCAAQEENDMSPQDARDGLTAVVHDTAALLDGLQWKVLSGPSVEACSVDGADGARYVYAYAAEPGADHAAAGQTVADYWKSLGLTVRTVTDPAVSVYADGGPVSSLSFHTEPGLYGITGTSVCVPGDADQLRDESPTG